MAYFPRPSAFTVEMLDTLEAAIATGVRSVYYGDKRCDYRSLDEMMRIRNLVMTALGIAAPQNNRKYAEFHSGFSSGFGGYEGSRDPYYQC